MWVVTTTCSLLNWVNPFVEVSNSAPIGSSQTRSAGIAATTSNRSLIRRSPTARRHRVGRSDIRRRDIGRSLVDPRDQWVVVARDERDSHDDESHRTRSPDSESKDQSCRATGSTIVKVEP